MKQKTKTAASKRFKISKKGKVQHLPVHRAHFNGKDTGDDTRRKHGQRSVASSDKTRIRQLLPYAQS